MPHPKPIKMSFKFLPHTRSALDFLAEKQGLTMTQVVEGAVERAAKRHGWSKKDAVRERNGRR